MNNKLYQIVERDGYDLTILDEHNNVHDAWSDALCLAKLSPANFNIEYGIAQLTGILSNDDSTTDGFLMAQSSDPTKYCVVFPKEGVIYLPDNVPDDYEHYLFVQCTTPSCDCRPFTC